MSDTPKYDPTEPCGAEGCSRPRGEHGEWIHGITHSWVPLERAYVKCPECDGGKVYATFVYRNGDTTDVPADCPYCGGAGTVLASALARDGR